MGEHLLRLDKEDVLEEAFGCFDETDQGLVDVKELRDLLATTGDKMTEEEVRSFDFVFGLFFGGGVFV